MSCNNKGFSLKLNGASWMWGYNGVGGLGDNTLTDRSSPVAVVGSHSFMMLSGSNGGSAGLKAAGQMWGWGTNAQGQIGDGTLTTRSSPVQVVGNHVFTSIATSTWNSYGLKDTGQIWAWGSNSYGQLGTGNNNSYSSPIQVIGSHSFTQMHASSGHVIALKGDGTAWAWGINNTGQVGNNTLDPKVSPVAVVGGHSFIQVAAGGLTNGMSIGLKINGSAWTWGYNGTGNLGDNTITSRSSPVAVIGGHSFVYVSGGLTTDQTAGSAGGLKSDGSLWLWGTNTYGQLGDGTTTNRSSPVQVVGSHSFLEFNLGNNFSMAVKSDGSVWSWGSNTQGRLGTNNATSYSSPVQVVGAHSFLHMASGTNRIPVCNSETWYRWPAYWVNISGSWKRVINMYQLINGAWKANSTLNT
jgi:alpha-tubulin suppressor-like RCC1 family protein